MGKVIAGSDLTAWCTARRLVLAALVVAASGAVAVEGEQVVCHYTYGGETRHLAAMPVDSAYQVGSVEVGSYFRFRVVFQNRPADLAAIKIYTYADRDDGTVLIHQATFPYPPPGAKKSGYGFTGLHVVYEPVRDGELQYWCEWKRGNVSRRQGRS